MAPLLERDWQPKLIKTLGILFPGAVIFKVDAGQIQMQGFPDLVILWRDRWAVLETKRADGSARRPNQEWYVESLNEMSFSAFISPDNEQDVLDALQQAFRT